MLETEELFTDMVYGTYEHTLDAKGRVFIPAKIKDYLGDTFVMTKSMDPCISVYSMDMWRKYVAKLSALPSMKARGIQRFVFASAVEASPDTQGRVLIPQMLREYARLEKEITIIGNNDHAEIWNAAKYVEFIEKQDVGEMVETLMELGF